MRFSIFSLFLLLTACAGSNTRPDWLLGKPYGVNDDGKIFVVGTASDVVPEDAERAATSKAHQEMLEWFRIATERKAAGDAHDDWEQSMGGEHGNTEIIIERRYSKMKKHFSRDKIHRDGIQTSVLLTLDEDDYVQEFAALPREKKAALTMLHLLKSE